MKTETITNGGFPYKEHTKFPSRYAIGELVLLDFCGSGKLTQPSEITAVSFTESKVYYDVAIRTNLNEDYWTVIENVDSCFVTDFPQIN